MKDWDIFNAESKPVVCRESGKTHWIDCGGQSYYWITKQQREIRQLITSGNETYDGFKSLTCTPHNITTDIQCLPEIFRTNYQPTFRVLIYNDFLIHLESNMCRENNNQKQQWWNECYNKIYLS